MTENEIRDDSGWNHPLCQWPRRMIFSVKIFSLSCFLLRGSAPLRESIFWLRLRREFMRDKARLFDRITG